MPERDSGLDKTDWVEDRKLAEKARRQSGLMPFYESEPDQPFAPSVETPPKE